MSLIEGICGKNIYPCLVVASSSPARMELLAETPPLLKATTPRLIMASSVNLAVAVSTSPLAVVRI